MARDPNRPETCLGDVNVANHPGFRLAYPDYRDQWLLWNIAWHASLVLWSEHWVSCTEHCRAGWDEAGRRRSCLRDNWHLSAYRFPGRACHTTDHCNHYGPAPCWTCEPVRVTGWCRHRIPICISRLHNN